MVLEYVLRGHCITFIFTLALVLLSIYFEEQFHFYYNSYLSNSETNKEIIRSGVITQNQLAEYNGVVKNKLYLAILGVVYDVTTGTKHYEKGAPYHYFIGKDASRAFITGNFKDESVNKDHILDLTCENLFALLNWNNTLKEKYKYVGVVSGRYYDEKGDKTIYSKQLKDQLDRCAVDKERVKQIEKEYPPCNIEWSADSGSRVWCSKTSGGIPRSWVGVPRQMYTPGDENPQCVCLNPTKDNSALLIKEYNGCRSTDTSCAIDSSD